MDDQPDTDGNEEETKDASAPPDVRSSRSRQKTNQRAEQAYKAAKRLAKRLQETAGRLTTSEWITAIFTAIIAGATLWNVVVVRSSLGIMRGQLDEMRSQEELTKIQMRARLRREQTTATVLMQGGKLIGWEINPRFSNAGGTDAIDYSGIWKLVAVPFNHMVTARDCPTPPTIPQDVGKTTEGPDRPFSLLAHLLTLQQAEKASGGKIVVFNVGRVEYRDIFPHDSLHHYIWCEIVVPNDLNGSGVFSFIRLQDETN